MNVFNSNALAMFVVGIDVRGEVSYISIFCIYLWTFDHEHGL